MGRSEFGTFGLAWTPPDYTVDERGKVVGGYQPAGLSNWGRWGDDDRLGTLNLITPERVLHATTLPRNGRVFSLALPLDETGPAWPTRPQTCHYVTMSGSDVITGTPTSLLTPGYAYNDDIVQMSTQGSTHWDGHSHIPLEDSFYNGFWAGSMTAMRGSETLGIGHWRASCTGRGVLLDLARQAGVEYLAPGTVFGADDLDATCEAQGISILPGDIVLLRTGSIGAWWELETPEQRLSWFGGWGGVGLSAVEWFHHHEVAAGACDCVGFEVFPHEDPTGVAFPLHHRLIVDLGFPIGEQWELDELAEDCAADGVYEFLLVAPPLALPRAAGSPLNPIAIK